MIRTLYSISPQKAHICATSTPVLKGNESWLSSFANEGTTAKSIGINIRSRRNQPPFHTLQYAVQSGQTQSGIMNKLKLIQKNKQQFKHFGLLVLFFQRISVPCFYFVLRLLLYSRLPSSFFLFQLTLFL